MARTRLRGLEIGGIQIGIEVPETCEWEWPETPVSDFQCLPRDPEVHVGLRVGAVERGDLGGERYALGAWTFEVARRGSDWLLGLSKGGTRAQIACFDREFRAGEIVISPEVAMRREYPLRGPIDEWLVLHRTVARGGLVLNATAHGEAGGAVVRLGAEDARRPGRWHTPSRSLLGRSALLLREDLGALRVFRTPWSLHVDPRLPYASRVLEIERVDAAEAAFDDLLDPADAADLLVTHAIVPLCDDGLLDRVLRNAQRIAAATRLIERGVQATSPGEAPMAWRSRELQAGLAPPRSEA